MINFGYAYMSYYDNFCNNRVIPCISTSIFCRVAKRADQELACSKHPINDVRKRYLQNYISYMPNWPLRDHLSNSIVAVLQENISQKLKNCKQKKKKSSFSSSLANSAQNSSDSLAAVQSPQRWMMTDDVVRHAIPS